MDLQHQCVKLELQCPGHFAMAPSAVKCSGKIKLIFLCIQSVVQYIISISVLIKNMEIHIKPSGKIIMTFTIALRMLTLVVNPRLDLVKYWI